MSERYQVVLIGYGNDLRTDDGAGQWVARAVAEWKLPHVHAIAVHQLTPELCVLLAAAEGAIFVDASVLHDTLFLFDELLPSEAQPGSAHSSHPDSLLALTQALYGSRPQAWLLRIAAHSFDFGLQLTPATQQACIQSLAWLSNQLQTRDYAFSRVFAK